MNAHVFPWLECKAAYEATGLPLGEDVEVTADQLMSMTEKFDVMVRTLPGPGPKIIYLSPLGRGFSQR